MYPFHVTTYAANIRLPRPTFTFNRLRITYSVLSIQIRKTGSYLFYYHSKGVTRRCNVLVRIIRHLSKVLSPLLRYSYNMRCEHFPFLFMVFLRALSECPALRQAGSFIGGVSTASRLAIGSMYMRGARYSHEGRVLLAQYSLCYC